MLSSISRKAKGSCRFGLSVVAVVCTTVATTLPAHATPEFPLVIRDYAALKQAPDCALCHVGGEASASSATVRTPFGLATKNHQAVKYEAATLRRALTLMESERTDSDRDGIPDLDELRQGGDPNLGSGANVDTAQPPEYGCAVARSAFNSGPGACVGCFGFCLGLLLVLRRRHISRHEASKK